MSRYIDADKLKSDIKETAKITGGNLTEFEVLGILSGQPTADVRENVRGKWVNNIHDIPICNQCGYMTPYDRAIDDYEYGNFCPNCGADMRGES